jgi:hypothetical protein
MGNVFHSALDSHRGNRDVAIWNLELRTTGKVVSGQHIRAICASQEIDQLQADIEFHDGMILALERKLEVLAQRH